MASETVDVSVCDIGGNEISKGAYNVSMRIFELLVDIRKSKPGLRCRLLHEDNELNPMMMLESLMRGSACHMNMTVLWDRGRNAPYIKNSGAFAAIKADGSVVTWGYADGGLVSISLYLPVVRKFSLKHCMHLC